MLRKLFLLHFCLCFVLSHAHWWENTKVTELTNQNFYDFVGKSQHVIVEFYTPWCVYCQAMFQQYEDLREMYNGENPKRRDVLIAKINGNSQEEITQRYGVYSYPTIVHFAPDKRDFDSIFQNYRTKDHMSEWIMKISGEEKKEDPPKIEVTRTEEEAKVEENKETPENTENEQKNMTGDKNTLDILITVADQIKFIDKMQKENTDKIMGELETITSHFRSKEKPQDTISFKSLGGLNVKHISIFFMLGMLLGLALAFTIMKFRKVGSHVIPMKSV